MSDFWKPPGYNADMKYILNIYARKNTFNVNRNLNGIPHIELNIKRIFVPFKPEGLYLSINFAELTCK